MQIEQAEIVGGAAWPSLRGRANRLARLGQIARAGAALEIEHRQREHGVAIAFACGALVPFRGFAIVAADAKPVGVKFSDEGHRGRVILLGALARFRRARQVVAALIGAIGKIETAFGGRGGRWWRRGGGFRARWAEAGAAIASAASTPRPRAAPTHAAVSGNLNNAVARQSSMRFLFACQSQRRARRNRRPP